MIKKYFLEIWNLKMYIIPIVVVIACSYSVYIFFDPETVANLGEEDHFFEWWTAISLFLACAICLHLFIRTKNIFHLLLSLLFFFGAGEEISWGQRILNFKTPEKIKEVNVQSEFNIHNTIIFNASDYQHRLKKGLARLLEMNFLFRLFMIGYGIFLPFLVYHVQLIRRLSEWIKLPVPPISIGIFFFVNWFVFWVMHTFILSSQYGSQYLDTSGEIFECIGAFILFVISSYFYIDRNIIVWGKDIKDYF